MKTVHAPKKAEKGFRLVIKTGKVSTGPMPATIRRGGTFSNRRSRRTEKQQMARDW